MIQTVVVIVIVIVIVILIVIVITTILNIDGSTGARVHSIMTRPTTITDTTP